MTRNEQQLYSDVTSIKESLKKIANALEKSKAVTHADVHNAKYNNDIPGFEGTLDALDVLCDIKTITDEYATLNQSNEALIARHKNKLSSEFQKQDEINASGDVHSDYIFDLVKGMSKEQYVKFFLDMDFGFALSDTAAFKQHCYVLDYEECLDAIKSALHITGELDIEERIKNDYASNPFGHNDAPTSSNPDPAGYGNKDPYTYDNALNEYCEGIKNDSDHDIRSTAQYYEEILYNTNLENLKTKKDCILDYVTEEFGVLGARYTDIIKFAYYLGSPNAPKYDNANRGYYSCAFSNRYGGHLISAGKDYFVKGINKEGKEKYFALSSVDSFTDYYKRIA